MTKREHNLLRGGAAAHELGLQLLAWHIEACNAQSGCGSREISRESSRENSSLSKCHCSDEQSYYQQHDEVAA